MSEPKDPSRRQAIRYLIGGAVVAACPFPAALLAGSRPEPGMTRLGSEENKLCHQVRDGASFRLPAPSEQHEVVIVGGGPSGLMTAYRLHPTDFLLLEKEPRLGGNAISEEWKGVWYSTGAAYQMSDEIEALCRELGMEIHRIRSVDAAVIHDTLVPEFWGDGLWKAPYPESVKKNWERFFKDMRALDTGKNREKLDAMSFAELLRPYGREVKDFFDNFGPNNWGAVSEDTSALIGAESVTWGGGTDPDRFTWAGGLGRISLALEERLQRLAPGRLRKNATVLEVRPEGSKVIVSYSENGEVKSVSARAVVVACPKFMAKHIVRGLDEEHRTAMDAIRYQPYLVVNVCCREVVYNGSYDTNVPAPSSIVDFNVADWVINRDKRETRRPSVLTCYVPRREADRGELLNDEYCIRQGQHVVELLNRWFPGARAKVEEVRIYRRGHPMYASAPGVLTRIAPKVRQPLGSVFFAHSDSEGGISEYSSALRAADRCRDQVRAHLGQQARRSTVGAGT